jgi:hypothetical protein
MGFQQAGAAAHMPRRSDVLAGAHLQGGNGSSRTLDVRHSKLPKIAKQRMGARCFGRHLHSCCQCSLSHTG